MAVSPAEDSALRALYEQHAAPLLAYAVRLSGGDRGRAEDIVQETLLRAWRHPQAPDPERGPARAAPGGGRPGRAAGWCLCVPRRPARPPPPPPPPAVPVRPRSVMAP